VSDEEKHDLRQLMRELDRLRDCEAKHLEVNAILAAQLAAVRARAAGLEENLREYGAVAEECTRLRVALQGLFDSHARLAGLLRATRGWVPPPDAQAAIDLAQAALLAKKSEVAA
jgi:hypothetical protein